jgi:serine/threonine protein kinase
MTKSLRVIDGPDQGRVFPLAGGALVIGSSTKNTDICLADTYVSRLHCKVEVDGERILVHDLKNSKGTFVNGKQVTRQEMHLGDVLRVGNSQLRLESDQGGSAIAGQPRTWFEELPGQAIGPYEVGPILGSGWHGAVFRATGSRSGHIVALKVLAPDFPATGKELQHFVDVLKPVLPLRHPHLVSLYGAGRAGAHCWLACDLVEGATAAHLAQRQHDEDEEGDGWKLAFWVATQVGRALAFAHQQGLRHGNITPTNVLWNEGSRTALLNDLVLAEALNGSALQQRILEKKFLAELPYLAPERTEENAFVDNLSDLYSLGVVVYELLTGHCPFKGGKPEETLDLIRAGKPARPSKYRPSVPGDFERAVLKMMALHQEERYNTAAEMLADLERIGEASGLKLPVFAPGP